MVADNMMILYEIFFFFLNLVYISSIYGSDSASDGGGDDGTLTGGDDGTLTGGNNGGGGEGNGK